jgi:hypothetical protein
VSSPRLEATDLTERSPAGWGDEPRREREAFFEWLEDRAARKADQNRGLSDEEVLGIIEQARE